SIIFAIPASRVAFSDHSIHEHTTASSSFAFTSRPKSVTLPSGISSAQHSRIRVAPGSMNTLSPFLACSMNFSLFALGTAIRKPSMYMGCSFMVEMSALPKDERRGADPTASERPFCLGAAQRLHVRRHSRCHGRSERRLSKGLAPPADSRLLSGCGVSQEETS